MEYEKTQWQLQRTAIEQFNGLRRELFDTTWRLAAEYNFPDDYRLTERQIKQYNDVLIDTDEMRKYERLSSIKEKFIAYPPFWYQIGSAANHIARNRTIAISDDNRENFRSIAVECFRNFWRGNEHGLLREDQIASACALEQIDLLNAENDRDEH